MTNQSDKDFLLGKLGDLEALHAAIFLTLPEEVRERLLAEYAQQKEDRQGVVGGAADSDDSMESLRAKVVARDSELADARAQNAALMKEVRALKAGRGSNSKVVPVL